jgi:hypothetical protein
MRSRVRVIVHGAVQGVGFRPFVFRLANQMRLAGWVNKSAQGVLIGSVESCLGWLEPVAKVPVPNLRTFVESPIVNKGVGRRICDSIGKLLPISVASVL